MLTLDTERFSGSFFDNVSLLQGFLTQQITTLTSISNDVMMMMMMMIESAMMSEEFMIILELLLLWYCIVPTINFRLSPTETYTPTRV